VFTIIDASITAADFGRVVKPGGGIPAGPSGEAVAFVGPVNAGASFALVDVNGIAVVTTGAVTSITLGNTTTKIATACVTNTTTSAVMVSVSVVAAGGAAGVTNRIIPGYGLNALDVLPLNDYLEGALLGPGDFISVNVSAANAVNFVATGAVGA
jgi:hypothetical protein